MSDLSANLAGVLNRIVKACSLANRHADSVSLLAVTKGHPPETIETLYHLGCRRFGESYLTELEQKWQVLEKLPDLKFVFIGPLQSNKIKRIISHSHELQSLATQKHIRLVAKAVADLNRGPSFPVYLTVNLGREPQKSGFLLDEVIDAAAQVKSFPQLELRGLMAIPPINAPLELYQQLAEQNHHLGLPNLSLGMSDDLERAIAAGSTEVRVGTALCGPRTTPD